MRGGREVAPPGRGPLAPAVVVDAGGVLRIVPADSIAALRASRLALGTLPDGRLLLVLTRFQVLGGVLALDGGVSGQLLVRAGDGGARVWTGWRRVPLGLVAEAREDAVLR